MSEAATATELKVGAHVLYAPHLDHCLETDHKGNALFHFHFESEPGTEKTVHLPAHGAVSRDGDGRLVTATGHAIRPGRAKRGWDAVVARVNEDGSADLTITHPFGQKKPGEVGGAVTLHYPDRDAHPEAPGIPRDPSGQAPHSFHLPEEAG